MPYKRWALSAKQWALSAALLSGCLSVNNPDTLVYSTKEYYRNGDSNSPGYGMQVTWLSPYGTRPLSLQYSEPDYWGALGDSLRLGMAVYVDTSPDLRHPRDPAEHGDLRIRFFDWDSVDDLGYGVPATKMVFESRNPGGEWRSRFIGGISRQKNSKTGNSDYFGSIPDSLLGTAPYFAWKVSRSYSRDSVSAPSVPTLFLRDESEFRRRVY